MEIVRDIHRLSGTVADRIQTLSDELDMNPAQIHLALDFYAAYPEEVDDLIAADQAAARRVRQLIEDRSSRASQ